MLSSPRKPVSTMRIFSSAENCRRVARRIPFTTCSAGSFTGPDFCPICAPSMATMGQKSSLPQLTRSVSVVLMPDSDHGRHRVLDPKEHAGCINRHDPIPGFGAVKILLTAAGDAGIVDQHIELAEMPRSGGHHGGPALLLGHIQQFEPCRGADAIGNLPAFVLEQVGDDYL